MAIIHTKRLAYGATVSGSPLTPARIKMTELSEKDVMNILEMTATEYNVDRSRVYFIGNSMGSALSA